MFQQDLTALTVLVVGPILGHLLDTCEPLVLFSGGEAGVHSSLYRLVCDVFPIPGSAQGSAVAVDRVFSGGRCKATSGAGPKTVPFRSFRPRTGIVWSSCHYWSRNIAPRSISSFPNPSLSLTPSIHPYSHSHSPCRSFSSGNSPATTQTDDNDDASVPQDGL
ncbi:hypothetical protein EDB84DRAFT_1479396 [Lactarius hengduanensis]|nr:hypothetical protein EDB84DRAFT_1479396 [Lactarius hengduanensis]